MKNAIDARFGTSKTGLKPMASLLFLFTALLPQTSCQKAQKCESSMAVYQSNWFMVAEHPFDKERVVQDKDAVVEHIIDCRLVDTILNIIKQAPRSSNERITDVRMVGIVTHAHSSDTLVIDLAGHARYQTKYFIANPRLTSCLKLRSFRLNPTFDLKPASANGGGQRMDTAKIHGWED